MKKKYTIEEFRKKFEEAKIEVIKKLDEDFRRATEEREEFNNLSAFAFSMQNMIAIMEMQKKLFDEEDE